MVHDNVSILLVAPPVGARLDTFFASLGQGVNAYSLGRERLPQIAALDARSDAELARIGLRREDILRHVFSDILAV